MQGLDALRGVAILSVLIYHGLNWDIPQRPPGGSWTALLVSAFSVGWLGVFLFFVLSGFLITGILFDSRSRPNYWRNFYIRRMLRIFPVFILVLIVIRVCFHASWAYLVLCLAYSANLVSWFPIEGFTYSVLWSLAVEEQFYLGWPILVRLLNRRALALVAGCSILFSPVLRVLSSAQVLPLGNVHSMTWLISDNLSMGAMLALLLRSRWGTERLIRRVALGLTVAGAAILIAGVPAGILYRNNLVGDALQTVPFEFMFGGALLYSLLIGSRESVLAWTRPCVFSAL